jgi:hypothetical protein
MRVDILGFSVLSCYLLQILVYMFWCVCVRQFFSTFDVVVVPVL